MLFNKKMPGSGALVHDWHSSDFEIRELGGWKSDR